MDRAPFVFLVALVFSSCGSSNRLVVGSKNFTEQVLLGEIVAQHLERRLGQPVDRKLNLGGTLLAHEALVAGQLDLYPEYTGTALTAVLKLPVDSDSARVLDRVRSEYRARWGLEWLAPLGFNNTFAMVVRGAKLKTLSEAARRKEGWALGVGYEFLQRPDGLPGLQEVYKLPLKEQPKSMDLGLLYRALEQNQVDMIAANATDGLISAMNLHVLRDDKGYFPPYDAAVVVRAASLKARPGLRAALQELEGKFSDETMRKLNYQVDGERRPAREVAAKFLAKELSAVSGQR